MKNFTIQSIQRCFIFISAVAALVAIFCVSSAVYAQAPDFLWAKLAGGSGSDEGRGIAVDGAGNSYVTGVFQSSATFGLGEPNETTLTGASSVGDIFVAKYDNSGALVWAKRAGGSGFGVSFGIAVDASGNSYVTGSFNGSVTFGPGEANETNLTSTGVGFPNIFLAKYDAGGALVWAKRAGGSNGDSGLGIAVDGAGNSYVTGSFRGSAIFGPGEANETTLTSVGLDDIFVAKYDANGALVWVKRAGASGDSFHEGRDVAVDGAGNSYVTGTFDGSATFGLGEANETTLSGISREIFVAKYDANGALVWAKRAGGSSFDRGFGLAVDGTNNSYVTGGFSGSATFGPGEANETTLSGTGGEIFVAKYDANGALVWAQSAGGSNTDLGSGIAVDGAGNSYVTGNFNGSATFGPGEANETTLFGTGPEIFVAKYDANGALVWAQSAGGSNIDTGNGIAVDGAGNSYVTGAIRFSATFGTIALTSAGGYDIFIAKLKGHDFVFLADENVEINGQVNSDGDIHSNHTIIFKEGNQPNSTHTGDLTAGDNIIIRKRNKIIGTAMADNDVDNQGTITGGFTEHISVARFPLVDMPGIAHGVNNIIVGVNKTRTLAPGDYNQIKVAKGGTLNLSSGAYNLSSLEMSEKSVLSLNLSSGNPISINVDDRVKLFKKMIMKLIPATASTALITFNIDEDDADGDDKVVIGDESRVFGSFVAPEATVEIGMKARLKGAVCAEKIKVMKGARFVHHNSTAKFPKEAGDDEEGDDDTEIAAVPTEYVLEQNYPNPFNPSTTISFALPEAGNVNLAIYDINGQLVKTLVSGSMPAGRHSVVWDGTGTNGLRVASGMYLYRLEANGFLAQKKLVLTK